MNDRHQTDKERNDSPAAGMHPAQVELEQALLELKERHHAFEQSSSVQTAYELAACLGNLGVLFNKLGQRQQAYGASADALGLFRQLHEIDPEDFAALLAMILNNVGNDLSALGRREEALAASQEALELRHRLYQTDQQAYGPDLAMSLNNVGSRLGDLGRREEALTVSQDALELRRSLYQTNPEAYGADLATSLNNLGNRLGDLGRREEALAASQESLGLYRRLYQTDQQAFGPDLAMSLNNMGGHLGDLGRREEALAASQEALELRRSLYRTNPQAYGPNLAMSLNNVGIHLSDLGHREEALTVSQEALGLYRRLYQTDPQAFGADLAGSLSNVGNRLGNLGRREEALAASQEALGLYRSLYQVNPQAFGPDLAGSLNNVGNRLSALGRRAEALATWHEAAELLVKQESMNPQDWCSWLSMLSPRLSAPESLRSVHMGALRRIGDLRRVPDFDTAAGPQFLKLQALLFADLWHKLGAASAQDPQLSDEALPLLLSSLQSPDLMRWLAANQSNSAEGRALDAAYREYLHAFQALNGLWKRLQGGSKGDGGGDGGGERNEDNAPDTGLRHSLSPHSAPDPVQLRQASEREVSARRAMHAAEAALAVVDLAFRGAYEVPSMEQLHRMLQQMQQACGWGQRGTAEHSALLCFLELPGYQDQPARLVGVLLSSTAAQARQIEFPGLLKLAQAFERYQPKGQRGVILRKNTTTTQAHDSDTQADAPPGKSFEELCAELDAHWWQPLQRALGEELTGLKVLHLCSHGIAHQLPFSTVSHLGLGGNVQLLQWPGLPYLRLAYSQRYADTGHHANTASATAAHTEGTAGLRWQISHDCAWEHETPLPMVAVEACLLKDMVHACGHEAQSVHSPEQIDANGYALVVCGHGSKASGLDSALKMRKGDLSTAQVMRDKLAPQIALIPACHAAQTADDPAHNALGVAAGFLLSGSKVVVGSIKQVPDALMPWFSTLLSWYVVHDGLPLHAAASRARQDFGAGDFPSEFKTWIRSHLANALSSLHPGSEESAHWPAPQRVKQILRQTSAAWPWQEWSKDALMQPLSGPPDLDNMRECARIVAKHALEPVGTTPQHMREMAAFIVVFGLG